MNFRFFIDLKFFPAEMEIFLILFIFAVLVLFGVPGGRNSKKYDLDFTYEKSIPGFWGLPLFGTTWVIPFLGYKVEEAHHYYKEMFRKFGKIFKEETFMNYLVVHVCDVKDIEVVLRSASRYPKRPPNAATAYYRGRRPDRYASLGIVNEQGKIIFIKNKVTCVPRLLT